MKFILDLCFEILDVEIWENSLCIFVYVKFTVFLMYVFWAAGLGKRSWEDSFRLPAFRAGCLWSLLYLSSFWQGENLMMPGNVLKRCVGTVRMQQNLGKWGFLMSMNHDHCDIISCDWLKLFSTLSQLMTHQSLPPAQKKTTVAPAFGTLPVPTCRFTCNWKGIKCRSLRAIQIVS